MIKILSHLVLLLFLTACNRMHKIGMHSVRSVTQASHASCRSIAKERLFQASNGYLVSFLEKDGIWEGKVYAKAFPDFSQSIRFLPVAVSDGLSIESMLNGDAKDASHMIHIEKTSDGKEIVYIGNRGLLGGGRWDYDRCYSSGCKNFYLRCKCGWRCDEGKDLGTYPLGVIPILGPLILIGRDIANRGEETKADDITYCERHCTCACKTHIVLCPKCYACPHCKYRCRECCGCVERIALKKRKEEKEEEERLQREKELMEQASYSYSYMSSTSSGSSYSPSASTSSCASGSSSSALDFRKKAEAARLAASQASSSPLVRAAGYVPSNASSTSTSESKR
ncbi:hypothetical protein ACRRVD_03005 [Candidatus Cardinium hertigii]|uniref:hypothetical protein n=1 Tax=Candidatus Cardinium hertigii TaxID=247481 RepID=UPI003D7E02DB